MAHDNGISMTRQHHWDSCLIQAWRDDANYAQLFRYFLRKIEEQVDVPLEDAGDYLVAIGVTERWRTQSAGMHIYYKMSVRGNIANRCPALSACLMNHDQPGNTDSDVFRAMPSFKWRSFSCLMRDKARSQLEDRKSIRSIPNNMYVHRSIRERDKSSSWNTTK